MNIKKRKYIDTTREALIKIIENSLPIMEHLKKINAPYAMYINDRPHFPFNIVTNMKRELARWRREERHKKKDSSNEL